MTTITTTADLPRARRGLATLLGSAVLASLVFVAAFALRYFTLNEQAFEGYWPHRWWLLVHIVAGIVAIFIGPLQLWWGLTDRRMALHRQLGIVYMASVAIGAPTGLYLAFNTENGYVAGAGLAGLSLAWALTTAMAYLAVRRQLYDQHKEWMIRSYVVTFAFVTFRASWSALQAAGVGTQHEQLAASSWFCWAVPLLVVEAVLQGRRIFGRPELLPRSD